MNNERNNTTAGGIGFCGLLAAAFIVLKLTGVINWSWLWVLAPIWIPTAITLAIIVIVLVAILVRELTREAARDDHGGTPGPAGSCDHDLRRASTNGHGRRGDGRADQSPLQNQTGTGWLRSDRSDIIFHRSTEEIEEAKLERLKNRLDGRNNWQGSSLHKWIENKFSAGGDSHE